MDFSDDELEHEECKEKLLKLKKLVKKQSLEIEDLQEQIEEKTDEINGLKSKFQRLEKQCEKKIEAKNKEINDLKDFKEGELRQNDAYCKEWANQIEKLENLLKTANNEKNNEMNHKRELCETNQLLMSEINDLNNKIKEVTMQMEEIKEKCRCKKMEERLEGLLDKLETQVYEKIETEKRMKEAIENIRSMKSKIDEVTKEKKELKDNHKKERFNLEMSVKELEGNVETQKEEFERRMKELENKNEIIERMKNKLKELLEQNKKLEEERNKYQYKVDKHEDNERLLKETIKTKDCRIENLEREINQYTNGKYKQINLNRYLLNQNNDDRPGWWQNHIERNPRRQPSPPRQKEIKNQRKQSVTDVACPNCRTLYKVGEIQDHLQDCLK